MQHFRQGPSFLLACHDDIACLHSGTSVLIGHVALLQFLEKLNIDCSKSSNAGADMRKQSQATKDIEQEVENDLKISSDSLEAEKID